MFQGGRTRPGGHLAILFSGAVLIVCLSGCASVPRTERARAGRSDLIAEGPAQPSPQRPENARVCDNALLAGSLSVLKDTGDYLLGVGAEILPHRVTEKQWRGWLNGSKVDARTDRHDRAAGSVASSARQWQPFTLPP